MTDREWLAMLSRLNAEIEELRLSVEALKNRLDDQRATFEDPDDLRRLGDEADNVGL